jgi:outer membrane receptor for ferrienterochelin and colicins
MKAIRVYLILACLSVNLVCYGADLGERDRGRIEGTVYDESTKEVLAEAKVEVLGTGLTVFTDAGGRFELADISSGNMRLRVHKRGFIPLEEVFIVSDGRTTKCEFYLHTDILMQYEVIVTATKTDVYLDEVPVSAELISEREIEALNITDIQDVFNFVSGLQAIRTTGSWGNKGNIRMQGLNENQSLILVNGQRYYGGHGGTDIASFPVDAIDKIEIVKGPSSVLYGSDAMGGVVNIITKSPSEMKPSFSASATGGSSNYQVYETSANYVVDKFAALFGFSYKHSDGRDASTDEMTENVFHGNLEYRFSPDLMLSVQPRYEHSKLTLDKRVQRRFSLNSVLDWKLDGATSIKLRGSLYKYNHETADLASDWDDDSYEFEGTVSRMLFGTNLVTAGAHFTREDIDDRGKDYVADQTLSSFYIQDQITVRPVTFVLGGRVDHHDLWGTEFNPKASVMVRVSDAFRLKGSVGRAFVAPKLVKLYATYRMGPYMVMPNADLDPETSVGYQLGGQWIPSGRFSLNASYFYNDISNMIDYTINRTSGYPYKMNWLNVAEASTQGVELCASVYPFDNFTLRSGYTFLDTEDKDTGEELLERPRHSLFVTAIYRIPEIGVDLSVGLNHRGTRLAETDNGLEELESYTTVDLSVSKSVFDFGRLFVRVQNLFDLEDVYDEYNLYGTQAIGGFEVRF